MTAMAQNYGITPEGSILRLNRKGQAIDATKYKTVLESFKMGKNGKYEVEGLSEEGYKEFRAAIKNTADQIVGNMNPDDIGRTDVSLLQNQMMSFRSWIPALVREWTGELRWNKEIQSFDWGRFNALGNEFNGQFTEEQKQMGGHMLMYMKHILVPTLSKMILDLGSFGIAPTLLSKAGIKGVKMTDVNLERAQRSFLKFQLKNPGLRDKVTFDDFLEIKQAQIRAGLMSLKFIMGFAGMAMLLASKDENNKPLYSKNIVTRDMYKVFSKAGSELTFMWNPTEFFSLISNPIPTTSLLSLVKKTAFNGIDEAHAFITGKRKPNDTTPAGYYLIQWMYGAPQLSRVLEIYKNMQKNPYSIYQTSSMTYN
jgi:hypothetical protein